MVYIKFGIVFELFVYKIYGDSNRAFLCGTEILNSGLNEMDFSKYTLGLGIGEFEVTIFRFNWDWRKIQDSLVTVHYSWLGQMCKDWPEPMPCSDSSWKTRSCLMSHWLGLLQSWFAWTRIEIILLCGTHVILMLWFLICQDEQTSSVTWLQWPDQFWDKQIYVCHTFMWSLIAQRGRR